MTGKPMDDAAPRPGLPCIGVVLVTYDAAEFIAECLESLAAARYPRLKIAVVDNASPDGTVAAVRGWASGDIPFAVPADWPGPRPGPVAKPLPFAEGDAGAAPTAMGGLTLIRSGVNLGFAGGVNIGLAHFGGDPEVDLFWVLNPDTVVHPEAIHAHAEAALAPGDFALIGCRACYHAAPEMIHVDGGQYRRWGLGAKSLNMGRPAAETKLPEAASLDYISVVSMLASRAFFRQAGPMQEGYFLYFEEIDWCWRRGDLPLRLAPGALIYHRAGASIGSGGGGALPSPLSAYFMARNLMAFTAKWTPFRLPVVYLVAWVQIARRYLRRGAWAQSWAALRGLHRIGPPATVRKRLAGARWRAGPSRNGPR